MLIKNLEDLLLKNLKSSVCKISYVQVENGIFHSVVKGFQQSWSQS